MSKQLSYVKGRRLKGRATGAGEVIEALPEVELLNSPPKQRYTAEAIEQSTCKSAVKIKSQSELSAECLEAVIKEASKVFSGPFCRFDKVLRY